ncbi:hypothetical protein DFH09DRAFT_1445496 [Mycena vulgaris]|nr:hypothetical protein DFH09DRAFT_1445496 [Mycena vulgaris]
MSDLHLEWIWSRYVTSPRPALHMLSLHQTCLALTKHVLQPAEIILSGGGFVLHPELAVLLSDVATSMDTLLCLAAKHHGLRNAPSIGSSELKVLTATEGLHACATQNRIVHDWVIIIDRLWAAMCELEVLCIGDPFDLSRSLWDSKIPRIASSLPLALRTKLPNSLLTFFGISTSSVTTAEARERSHVLAPLQTKLHPSCVEVPLSDRVKSILRKSSLDPSDVVDHGDNSHRLIGQFALENGFAISLENTVREMQSELTRVFSPTAERPTCFVVDPHGELLQTLQGASSLDLLLVVWATLSRRVELAQTRLVQYQTLAQSICTRDLQLLTELPFHSSRAQLPRNSISDAPHERKNESGTDTCERAATRVTASAGMQRPQDPLDQLADVRKEPKDRGVGADDVCASTASDLGRVRVGIEVGHGALRSKTTAGQISTTACSHACSLGTLPVPARLQSSSPPNLVVDAIAIEPGELDEVRRLPAESISFPRNHTPLTSRTSVKAMVVAIEARERTIATSATELRAVSDGKDFPHSAGSPTTASSAPTIEGLDLETRSFLAKSSSPQCGPSSPSLQPPAPALVIDLSTVELGGLKDSDRPPATPHLEARTSDKDSGASGEDHPLVRTAHGYPSTRESSPLQSSTSGTLVADVAVVELGGPRDSHQQMNIPHLGVRTMDESARMRSEYHPQDCAPHARSSLSASPAPAFVSDETTVELGGLQRRLLVPNQSGLNERAANALTAEAYASPRVNPSTSDIPAASASKSSMLISAVLRTSWIKHLVCIMHGDLAPCLAWEREGIGTPLWI